MCVTLTNKWLASLCKKGIVENVHKFIRSAVEFATTNNCKQCKALLDSGSQHVSELR